VREWPSSIVVRAPGGTAAPRRRHGVAAARLVAARLVAALLATSAVGGCRLGLRPADVATASRLVAGARKDPSVPRTFLLGSMLDDRPAYAWSGQEMALARRGPGHRPRARLVVDLVDERGGSTEFTVDTGTSISCLSTFAPAAATARRDPAEDCPKYKDGTRTCRGTLPLLVGGGLRGAAAHVLLIDRPHDLSDSTNLFGMTWMAGLALVHDVAGDRWRFVPGGSIPERPGWASVRMEAPALPVVRLVGPGGVPTYGLIDTGAPTSLSERGAAPGRYRLLDTEGRMVLDVIPTDLAPWKDLDPGGRPVTVWIGLRDLESRSFVMDFTTGVWSIGPAESFVARRPVGR